MVKTTLLTLLLLATSSLAQQPEPEWNGYVQVRYTDDFQNLHAFEVRRAKLWMYRQTPFLDQFHYKVQGKFSFKNQGNFILQDVFAEYRFKNGWIRAGQQKPDFSLERNQSDYLIAVAERTLVVDALIPAAESGARDIGLQLHLKSKDKWWNGSAGWFNGTGGNRVGTADGPFLFTTRQRFHFAFSGNINFNMGVSGSYRKGTGMRFRKIFPADSLFSGKDFRYGAEAEFGGKSWSLQGEYIEAHFENQRAFGWYLLGEYYLSDRHLIGIQAEYFSDLNAMTEDNPAYDLSYSWLLKGQDAKVLADLRVQPDSGENNISFLTQFQLFFN